MIVTGIDKLDAEFGGFEAGRVYLVKGASGTGKTLFGLQYLAAGLDRGEPGLLVTSERGASVVQEGEKAGIALGPAITSGRLTLLEYPEELEALCSPVSGLELKDILAELSRHLHPDLGGRAVIDPVTPLLQFARGREPAAFARALAGGLAALGPTVLLTAEAPVPPDFQLVLTALEGQAYGTIELSLVPVAGGFDRRMRITRLRGGPARQAAYRFEIEKDRIAFPERAHAPAAIARRGEPANLLAPLGDNGGPAVARAEAPVVIAAPPAYIQHLGREAARAQRYGRPFSVALFSLEPILEGVGREAPVRGEPLVRRLLQVFQTHSRETESIARYSYDRVVVFLPETPQEGALVYVRRLQQGLRETLIAERVYEPASLPELRYSVASYPEDLAAGDLLDVALGRLIAPSEG